MSDLLKDSGVDVAAVRAKWDAMNADLRARLPETDNAGKKVDPSKHTVGDEKLVRLVREAVTLEVVDGLVQKLKAEVFAAVKASK